MGTKMTTKVVFINVKILGIESKEQSSRREIALILKVCGSIPRWSKYRLLASDCERKDREWLHEELLPEIKVHALCVKQKKLPELQDTFKGKQIFYPFGEQAAP